MWKYEILIYSYELQILYLYHSLKSPTIELRKEWCIKLKIHKIEYLMSAFRTVNLKISTWKAETTLKYFLYKYVFSRLCTWSVLTAAIICKNVCVWKHSIRLFFQYNFWKCEQRLFLSHGFLFKINQTV